MSSSEPLAKIRQIADEWKQPFQKEYTERSVNQAFEKLLALRAVVERTVERVIGKPIDSSSAKSAAEDSEAANNSSDASEPPRGKVVEKCASPATKKNETAEAVLDFESCMEQIWEQLISAPPSRGRSMTTVKLGGVRLLMSSWEVAAFVSEDGPAAEDLRRAVVARALVTSATENAKGLGSIAGLDRVLPIARVEVSRLQERVEEAKQAKDTEAAVNLGISTKRLLSALDEAEKL